MMLDIHLAAPKNDLHLRAAMLVYGGRGEHGQAESSATVHHVEMVDERPAIMPGRLVTEADLVNLARSLKSAQQLLETEWLDTRVLARGPDRVIWWSPPGKRAVFFSKSTYNKKTFDAAGMAPIPGLVWMAKPGDGLYVYAFRGSARPTPTTRLCQAPLFNVWARGKVCVGNAQLPDAQHQGDLDAWEKVIFGTRFSHPNFTEKNRLVKGIDPCAFWKQMVAKPPAQFPEERLVDMPFTVQALLELDVTTRLSSLRAGGEF